jgi:hypothetical protein
LNTPVIGQGACLADLDNDGDLDVIVNNMNDAAELNRNNASAPRVAVRLQGLPPNTKGIGARISVPGGPVAPKPANGLWRALPLRRRHHAGVCGRDYDQPSAP